MNPIKCVGAIFATVLIITSCDSAFMGSGGSLGGNNSTPFQSGDGMPAGNNNSGDQFGDNFDPNAIDSGLPGDGTTENDLVTGDLGGGDGFDETIFTNGSVTILRADGSKSSEYNHSDIELELSVGDKTTGPQAIGSEGASALLESVCTSGDAVAFNLEITHKGRPITPNRGSSGGILFYRESPTSILFGYEYEAATTKAGSDKGPDENDDVIGRISCLESIDDMGNEISISVNNACFDQNINVAGWLSPTENAGPNSRSCTGT
ncbi:hypothetical protein N9D31_03420 [Oligoflexaceae bacterium]|nr:hypothetical protein [Oligoflexaceae bacterium]